MGLTSPFGACGHIFEVAFQLHQTIKLPQAQRCRRRRILGACAKAVPPPEIPLKAHKPLAGAQQGLQARGIRAADHTDLGNTTAQHLGHLDLRGKGFHPFRQGLIGVIGGHRGPA